MRLAERVLGVRSGESLKRLVDEIDAYYKDLSRVMPADQKAAIERIARTAMERVTASVGEGSGVTEGWLTGYLNGYYSDANERLCQTCQRQMEKIIAGADGDVVSALREKLGDWGENRAEVMARHEAALALNKTLVAGFYRAGYSAVWKAAPGSCKMCMLLNDQTVTTLVPPLHRGCSCTVDKGAKIHADLTSTELSAKITAEMNAAGMKGVASVPPIRVDTSNFRFDAEHVKERKHGVSEAEARDFIRDASISITRWNGQSIRYYGRNGAAFVRPEEALISTAFRYCEYDARAVALMEVLARYGL